jgi:CubicO group peptidase (beta-lactamase class C family)
VTAETLFQAASMSKPVAAVAVLRLVETGTLALDEDVNGYLRSWRVPENEHTRESPVTLGRLLSHTAGMTVHGFPGYRHDAALPCGYARWSTRTRARSSRSMPARCAFTAAEPRVPDSRAPPVGGRRLNASVKT